jgi:hypothetical protein
MLEHRLVMISKSLKGRFPAGFFMKFSRLWVL